MLTFSNPLHGVERCPHCGIARPLLTSIWNETLTFTGDRAGRRYAIFQCSSCFRGILAEGHMYFIGELGLPTDTKASLKIEKLYPAHPVVDEAIPEDARRYLKQAMDTLHAPDASAVMSASAVDAMLKAKGYAEGSLYTRIGQAVDAHILTEAMGDWAHAVRLEANAVRHADANVKQLTADDSKQILEFAKALGDFLFVFSARVNAGLKRAKPNGNST